MWSRGALHPIPTQTVMGVPADLRSLGESGLLSAAGLARAALDEELPATPVDGDVSVGSYVAERFGREVVDRLVDPLLGGVYAGRADDLSLDATLPQLAPLVRTHASLLGAAQGRTGAAAGGARGPVFASVTGGLGTFAEVLTEALAGPGRAGRPAGRWSGDSSRWPAGAGGWWWGRPPTRPWSMPTR